MLLRELVSHREQFMSAHSMPWLVWERGVWKPPTVDETTAVATSTLQEARALSDGSDLLCFELKHTLEASFRIGRDPTCDVIINDATVSRNHATLSVDAQAGWTFEVAPGSRGALRAQPVPAAAPMPTSTCDQLKLGDVLLTFYLPGDLLQRLDEEHRGTKRA